MDFPHARRGTTAQPSQAGPHTEHKGAAGVKLDQLTSRLYRFAQYAGLGLLTTPAVFFWFLMFVETHVPDLTLRELMQFPFAREVIVAWAIGAAVVVAATTDPNPRATKRDQAPR